MTTDRLRSALFRLNRFANAAISSSPSEKARLSFNDLRFSDTVLGHASPGEYGDESDPWPEETAAYLRDPAVRAALDDSLGAAWAEAEAALPDGWELDGVRALWTKGKNVGWVARAVQPAGWYSGSVPLLTGEGPTPAAALRALAARLREVAR